MASRVITVNDILDGHVGLDLECFDRIYLNGWVPNLQVSGQVIGFLTHHLGFPIPSPAILEKIGLRVGAGGSWPHRNKSHKMPDCVVGVTPHGLPRHDGV